MERFLALMPSYAACPDPAKAIDLFLKADPDHCNAQMVLVAPVFLSLVLDAAPGWADHLVDRARQGHAIQQEMAAQALNYCHLPDRARLMERLVGERAAAEMEAAGADFKGLHPSHPLHVDMLLACFFATGDGDYVDGLIALLPGWLPPAPLDRLVEQAKKDKTVQAQAMAGLLAQSAMHALSTHAGANPHMRQRLQAAANRQDGLVAVLAARILAGLILPDQ